jgi:hypothetical protein
MSEPRKVVLRKTGDYDGTSAISLIRDQDLAAVNGGLVYTAVISGPAGIIPADFWGLFSAERPKLVGVAFSSRNPRSVIRVVSASGHVREEVNLTPSVQYVMLTGQDKLAVLTSESSAANLASTELHLEINEVSEADHVQWALSHPPGRIHTRFKLIRQVAFVKSNVAPPFIPSFVWDPINQMFTSNDPTDGPIPIAALSPFARGFGTLVSVRYSGSNNDGEVATIESVAKSQYTLQSAIPNGRWSRVFYASHDDSILLAATPLPQGVPILVCDIETVAVEPADRLRGRYEHPEVLPDPFGHNL